MSTVFKPDQVRYELEHKLGEGLNSNVWRAKRVDFAEENPRTVALKLPKDQTSVPFLRREFETLTRINSMHVVRALAWESCNGEPALALEWIDGVTLTDLAQKTPLNLAARDEITRQIRQSLSDLNDANTCHGDLHPGNIMIDREGRVKLIDFASGKTRDGLVQATPAFVSPEIWGGADFSLSSDLFALNVIHEHMLDGYRRLPLRSLKSRESKPARENRKARREIGDHVARLLDQTPGTQVVVFEPAIKLKRSLAAALVAALFVLHVPVFAEDPPLESPGSAQILVTSQSWMKIVVNGKAAGFAPLKLMKMKSGVHHLEWESAEKRGEFHLNVHAGDTLRLIEKKGRLELR